MLLEIKNYLMHKSSVPLQEVAVHFKQQPESMRLMMQHWIRKGKVKVIKPSGCGSTCTQCKPEFAEEYCWIETIKRK